MDIFLRCLTQTVWMQTEAIRPIFLQSCNSEAIKILKINLNYEWSIYTRSATVSLFQFNFSLSLFKHVLVYIFKSNFKIRWTEIRKIGPADYTYTYAEFESVLTVFITSLRQSDWYWRQIGQNCCAAYMLGK